MREDLYMKYEALRQSVIAAALSCQAKGLIKGTSGNISLKSGDGRVIAITPSGIEYQEMTPEDVPLVDITGKTIDGVKKPSSELPMHLSVLRARPDLTAVVHTHSMYATVFAVSNIDLPCMTIPQLAFGLAPVKVVPFELPGSQELGDAVVRSLGETGKAVLLQNHGLLCGGKDLHTAMYGAEYVEEAAEVAYYSMAIGKLNPIPQKQIDRMMEILSAGRAL
jgi:L-fuculose-phosphate aldolase